MFTGWRPFFLFFFISFFFSFKNSGDLNLNLSFSYEKISKVYFSWFLSNFLRFIIILSLLVKLPIFFQIWLPKAHVEAPVFGSIFLARVILKLEGFRVYLLRWMLLFNNFFLFLVRIIPYLWFLSRISCFSKKDLKVLIALSRVNHISFFNRIYLLAILIYLRWFNINVSIWSCFFNNIFFLELLFTSLLPLEGLFFQKVLVGTSCYLQFEFS